MSENEWVLGSENHWRFDLDSLKALTTNNKEYSQNEHTVYPNPTEGIVTIEAVADGHYSIEITSLDGRLISCEYMEGKSCTIDLSSFRDAVYIITIRSNDLVTSRKIIKV